MVLLSARCAAEQVANISASKFNENVEVSKQDITSAKSTEEPKSALKSSNPVQNANNGAVPAAMSDRSTKKPTSTAIEFVKADMVANETTIASSTTSSNNFYTSNSSQAIPSSNNSLPSTSPPNICNPSSFLPSGGFHGWSFVGGILLSSALVIIAFAILKYYKMKNIYGRF